MTDLGRLPDASREETLPELLDISDKNFRANWVKSPEWIAFAKANPEAAARLKTKAKEWIEAAPYLLGTGGFEMRPDFVEGYVKELFGVVGIAPLLFDGNPYDYLQGSLQKLLAAVRLSDDIAEALGKSEQDKHEEQMDDLREWLADHADEISAVHMALYPNETLLQTLLEKQPKTDAAETEQRKLAALYAAPLQEMFAQYQALYRKDGMGLN